MYVPSTLIVGGFEKTASSEYRKAELDRYVASIPARYKNLVLYTRARAVNDVRGFIEIAASADEDALWRIAHAIREHHVDFVG